MIPWWGWILPLFLIASCNKPDKIDKCLGYRANHQLHTNCPESTSWKESLHSDIGMAVPWRVVGGCWKQVLADSYEMSLLAPARERIFPKRRHAKNRKTRAMIWLTTVTYPPFPKACLKMIFLFPKFLVTFFGEGSVTKHQRLKVTCN